MNITTIYSHVFCYIHTVFITWKYCVLWGRLHFATYMCYINNKFIFYANIPSSNYSQFTVKIMFENSVTGYMTLLCMSIT